MTDSDAGVAASDAPPPNLVAHVERTLSATLPGERDAARRLVRQLMEQALLVAPENRNTWMREAGGRVAERLRIEPMLGARVVANEMNLADVLAADAVQCQLKEQAYGVISGRHRQLRQTSALADDATSSREWADDEALTAYAAAASVIGARAWVREGIDWCAEQACGFFLCGGAARLARKEAA
jgi:hypothetical protein